MSDRRPHWIEWALNIAEAVATRADCTRRQVGAVILDRNNWPIAVGYNGSYPTGPSCLAGECPRGKHYGIASIVIPGVEPKFTWCNCGRRWPCPEGVPAGSSYDTGPGACHSVHAELNARLHVDDVSRMAGGYMVVTERPCDGCLKILRSTPLTSIHWKEEGRIHGWMWPFMQ